MCFRMSTIFYVNSLWPSDAIWQEGSRSTLVQVMACCLMAPSHYLNQCWLIVTKVQWCSSEGNFAWDITSISHWNSLENYFSRILLKSHWGQWVNLIMCDFLYVRCCAVLQVNPKLVDQFEAKGLHFVGQDVEGERMEIMELSSQYSYVIQKNVETYNADN